jgi:hypothetical protein
MNLSVEEQLIALAHCRIGVGCDAAGCALPRSASEPDLSVGGGLCLNSSDTQSQAFQRCTLRRICEGFIANPAGPAG